jgi:hypothetical protein
VLLNNRKIAGAEIAHIAQFPNLKYLKVGDAPEGVEITEQALQLVGAMAGLEFLQICKEGLKDRDLAFLPRLTKLKELWIQGADMIDPDEPHGLTDDAAAFIGKLKHLEVLHLYGNGSYTDGFFQAICQLPRLRSLRFQSDAVTDNTLVLIAKQKSLAEVEILSSVFTPSGVKALMNAPSLKKAVLRWPNGRERFQKK